MKIGLILLLGALSLPAMAQSNSSSSTSGGGQVTRQSKDTTSSSVADEGAAETSSIPDGIVMREGKVYFCKHGQPKEIENETRLSEGIVANKKGEVTLKDGRKLTLQNGQMVTLDGQVQSAPVAGAPSSDLKAGANDPAKKGGWSTSGPSQDDVRGIRSATSSGTDATGTGAQPGGNDGSNRDGANNSSGFGGTGGSSTGSGNRAR